jgi:hypothetical protein
MQIWIGLPWQRQITLPVEPDALPNGQQTVSSHLTTHPWQAGARLCRGTAGVRGVLRHCMHGANENLVPSQNSLLYCMV